MTIGDYSMVMKRVGVAELKARLSEYLRLVRRGEALTVLDRDTPVAQVVPYDTPQPLQIHLPARGAQRLRDVPLPPPLHLDADVLELLEQERRSER
jgi:prevent-host-death family protein